MQTAPPPPDPRSVLARHGRSFHFASRFLGSARALDCARLYAFCRHLDDLADDPRPASDPLAELAQVEAQLRNGDAVHPAVRDFLDLAGRHDIDIAAAQALVRGLRLDCGPVMIADEAALLRYAYSVAGTVGEMIAPILGARSRRAIPHAIDLGIAMQLTNIARDVAEDAAMGRRYLPGDWIAQLPPSALAEPTAQTRAAGSAAVGRVLELADRYYASAEAGFRYLPPRSRLAIAVAARCYRAIGVRLRAGRPQWWQGRAVVGTAAKCRIALVEALPRAFAWAGASDHDRTLHAALVDVPHANR